VFVSVDPVRDTPQQLARYVSFFGAGMLGVTGDDTELRRLAQSLGMDFRREGAADTPTISHSPTIALIGPDGTMRARLRPGFDTQQAARELAARIGADA
jgi:protein SCO1